MVRKKFTLPSTGHDFGLIRHSLGATQNQVARCLGIPHQALARWEASSRVVDADRAQRWTLALRTVASERATMAENQGHRWVDVLTTGHQLLINLLVNPEETRKEVALMLARLDDIVS